MASPASPPTAARTRAVAVAIATAVAAATATKDGQINALERQMFIAKTVAVVAPILATIATVYFTSAWDSALQFLGLQEVPIAPINNLPNNPPTVPCDCDSIPVDSSCSQDLLACQGDVAEKQALLEKCKAIGRQFQAQRNEAKDDWKACLERLAEREITQAA